jgi:hypothetical protein
MVRMSSIAPFVSIRKFDTDKFKPLGNFIKRNTADTEDKNVELLAWLIGYEPRPYEYGKSYKTGGAEKQSEEVIEDIPNDKNGRENINWQKYAAVALVLLLSGGGYMLFNGDKQQENHNAVHVAENGQRMY